MRAAMHDRLATNPAWVWVDEDPSVTNYVALNKITLENLEFMSGALGRAHAVRVRCNGSDDQYWRQYQVDFLNHFANRETANQVVRQPMVDAFNDAYTKASSEFDTCTKMLAQVERDAAKRVTELVGLLKPDEHGIDQAIFLHSLETAAVAVISSK
ncbi:MAG: DUF2385 domain-containing protein [Hyphomonadaceae bacterium]